MNTELCGVQSKFVTPGRDGRKFLIIARGSTEETRYLLLLAKDLGLLPVEVHARLEASYTEVSKMTNALLRSLKP